MSLKISILLGSLVLLSVTLLTMDLFGVSLTNGDLDPGKVGTVAEWVTGLLTAATILIAVVAVREDRRRENEEQRLRERQEAMRQREIEQSREVKRIEVSRACWAWLTVGFDYTGQRINKAVLHVKNETGLPIYAWNAELESGGLAMSETEYGPILPGTHKYDCRQQSALDAVRKSDENSRILFRFKTRFGEVVVRDADGRIRQSELGEVDAH